MPIIKSRDIEVPDALAESIYQLMITRKDMTALARTLRDIATMCDSDVMINILQDAASDIVDSTDAMNEAHNQMVAYFADLEPQRN